MTLPPDASRVGTITLRRVAGSNPPEWGGEAVVHSFAYRLKAEVVMGKDGAPQLAGTVWWSPAIAREGTT